MLYETITLVLCVVWLLCGQQRPLFVHFLFTFALVLEIPQPVAAAAQNGIQTRTRPVYTRFQLTAGNVDGWEKCRLIAVMI